MHPAIMIKMLITATSLVKELTCASTYVTKISHSSFKCSESLDGTLDDLYLHDLKAKVLEMPREVFTLS